MYSYALTINNIDWDDIEPLKSTLEEIGEVLIIEEREDSVFINGAFNGLDLELLETFFDDYTYELTIAGEI